MREKLLKSSTSLMYNLFIFICKCSVISTINYQSNWVFYAQINQIMMPKYTYICFLLLKLLYAPQNFYPKEV